MYNNSSDLPGKSTRNDQATNDLIDIGWENLIVSGNQKNAKPIINNVSGYVRSGSLMAIIGSSGAGKSTLMNVIAGRNLGNLDIKGQIKINGIPAGNSMAKLSAYVQQDDIFIGSMTVYEHLCFHAALRMSKEKAVVRKNRVQEVLDQMGLVKCKDTIIGTPGISKTISGGEMKRLSFASEILTYPAVIFCDEPTSGLDSFLAETVIRTLKELADGGTTIFCTIHQPSSQVFRLFNKLLLLAQGNIAYLGSTRKAAYFFESIGLPIPDNYNPCDHYIEHVAIMPGNEARSFKQIENICNLYKKSRIFKQNEKQVHKNSNGHAFHEVKPPRFMITLRWLFWRACISQYRDTTFAIMKLSQNLGVAFVIGLLFLRIPWDSPYTNESTPIVTSSLFVMVTSYSMCFLFLVLMAFPLQIPVLRREHYGRNYTILAAFLAETFAGIPFFIIMPMFYTTIIYFMCGFAPSMQQFFWCYFGNVLVGLSSTGYGYFISALAPSVKAANTIAPSLLIPLFLLSGFFIPALDVPIYFIPLQYLSWFYYGVELLVINQWENTNLCVNLNTSINNIPLPDNCFNFATTTPISTTVNPPTTDPGATGSPIDPGEIIGNIEDIIFSNDSCLVKDIIQCPESHPIVFEGSSIIPQLNYDSSNFERNVALLITLAIGFRILAYAVLTFRFREANR